MKAPVRARHARANNRSHTREDLLKKENRVNLMLFGAQGIPEFWKQLCDLLGISQSAWLTREVIAGTGRRPDFILNNVNSSQGCIEVELGGPSDVQLQSYKEKWDPVICIVGKRGRSHGHKSLEEVADLARKVAAALHNTNRPAEEVLGLLANTIEDGLNGFRERSSVQPIPAQLLNLPWFAATIEPLLRLEQAGYVVNRTTSAQSLSLQLQRVPCLGGKSLALLTQRDPTAFLLPVPGEMIRIFGEPLGEVSAAWKDMLEQVMPKWPVHQSGNGRIRMDAKDFEQNGEAFAEVFAQLAKLVLKAPGRPTKMQ